MASLIIPLGAYLMTCRVYLVVMKPFGNVRILGREVFITFVYSLAAKPEVRC